MADYSNWELALIAACLAAVWLLVLKSFPAAAHTKQGEQRKDAACLAAGEVVKEQEKPSTPAVAGATEIFHPKEVRKAVGHAHQKAVLRQDSARTLIGARLSGEGSVVTTTTGGLSSSLGSCTCPGKAPLKVTAGPGYANPYQALLASRDGLGAPLQAKGAAPRRVQKPLCYTPLKYQARTSCKLISVKARQEPSNFSEVAAQLAKQAASEVDRWTLAAPVSCVGAAQQGLAAYPGPLQPAAVVKVVAVRGCVQLVASVHHVHEAHPAIQPRMEPENTLLTQLHRLTTCTLLEHTNEEALDVTGYSHGSDGCPHLQVLPVLSSPHMLADASNAHAGSQQQADRMVMEWQLGCVWPPCLPVSDEPHTVELLLIRTSKGPESGRVLHAGISPASRSAIPTLAEWADPWEQSGHRNSGTPQTLAWDQLGTLRGPAAVYPAGAMQGIPEASPAGGSDAQQTHSEDSELAAWVAQSALGQPAMVAATPAQERPLGEFEFPGGQPGLGSVHLHSAGGWHSSVLHSGRGARASGLLEDDSAYCGSSRRSSLMSMLQRAATVQAGMLGAPTSSSNVPSTTSLLPSVLNSGSTFYGAPGGAETRAASEEPSPQGSPIRVRPSDDGDAEEVLSELPESEVPPIVVPVWNVRQAAHGPTTSASGPADEWDLWPSSQNTMAATSYYLARPSADGRAAEEEVADLEVHLLPPSLSFPTTPASSSKALALGQQEPQQQVVEPEYVRILVVWPDGGGVVLDTRRELAPVGEHGHQRLSIVLPPIARATCLSIYVLDDSAQAPGAIIAAPVLPVLPEGASQQLVEFAHEQLSAAMYTQPDLGADEPATPHVGPGHAAGQGSRVAGAPDPVQCGMRCWQDLLQPLLTDIGFLMAACEQPQEEVHQVVGEGTEAPVVASLRIKDEAAKEVCQHVTDFLWQNGLTQVASLLRGEPALPQPACSPAPAADTAATLVVEDSGWLRSDGPMDGWAGPTPQLPLSVALHRLTTDPDYVPSDSWLADAGVEVGVAATWPDLPPSMLNAVVQESGVLSSGPVSTPDIRVALSQGMMPVAASWAPASAPTPAVAYDMRVLSGPCDALGAVSAGQGAPAAASAATTPGTSASGPAPTVPGVASITAAVHQQPCVPSVSPAAAEQSASSSSRSGTTHEVEDEQVEEVVCCKPAARGWWTDEGESDAEGLCGAQTKVQDLGIPPVQPGHTLLHCPLKGFTPEHEQQYRRLTSSWYEPVDLLSFAILMIMFLVVTFRKMLGTASAYSLTMLWVVALSVMAPYFVLTLIPHVYRRNRERVILIAQVLNGALYLAFSMGLPMPPEMLFHFSHSHIVQRGIVRPIRRPMSFRAHMAVTAIEAMCVTPAFMGHASRWQMLHTTVITYTLSLFMGYLLDYTARKAYVRSVESWGGAASACSSTRCERCGCMLADGSKCADCKGAPSCGMGMQQPVGAPAVGKGSAAGCSTGFASHITSSSNRRRFVGFF